MLAGLLLLALPAAAGKIQRFTDEEGTLHITDSESGEQAKPGPGAAPIVRRPGSFPGPGVQPSPPAPPETPAVQPSPPPEPEPPEEGEGPDEPEEEGPEA